MCIRDRIQGQEKRTEKCLWQAGMCWAKEGLRAKKAKQRTVAAEAFEQVSWFLLACTKFSDNR